MAIRTINVIAFMAIKLSNREPDREGNSCGIKRAGAQSDVRKIPLTLITQAPQRREETSPTMESRHQFPSPLLFKGEGQGEGFPDA